MARDKDDLMRGTKEVELVPDAWERFERAVDTVSKSGPQHRQKERASDDQIRQRERVFPSASQYEEWGVYAEPDIPKSLALNSSARRKRPRGRWIPHGRSVLHEDGSLEIEFLS